MPELPEVETVARGLQRVLTGRSLIAAKISDSRLLPLNLRPLSGHRVERVFRRGKQVVMQFSKLNDRANGRAERLKNAHRYLVVHLRMTGRLIWLEGKNSSRVDCKMFMNNSTINAKHIRARLRFDRGELLFIDPRRFGTMVAGEDLECLVPISLEPLSRKCTPKRLANLLADARQEIKPWLLRQDRLVGLGNIYASEILFRARLHPRRLAYRLSNAEIAQLNRAIKWVLQAAIRHCGTTFSDFQNALGEQGGFQNFLKVYDLQGQPCRCCGTVITKIVQQGRSTYFCATCQRDKRER